MTPRPTPETNAATFWGRDMGDDKASPHFECVAAEKAARIEQERDEAREAAASWRAMADTLADAAEAIKAAIEITLWTHFDGNEQIPATAESLREDFGPLMGNAFGLIVAAVAAYDAKAEGQPVPDLLAEVVKRMEAVPLMHLAWELHQNGGLEAIRARLIQAAKGGMP